MKTANKLIVVLVSIIILCLFINLMYGLYYVIRVKYMDYKKYNTNTQIELYITPLKLRIEDLERRLDRIENRRNTFRIEMDTNKPPVHPPNRPKNFNPYDIRSN